MNTNSVSLAPPKSRLTRGRRTTGLLAQYPASFILLLQYTALVLLPAFAHGESLLFVLSVTGLGIGTVALVETLMVLSPRPSRGIGSVGGVPSIIITLLGLLARLVATALGAHTYETQIEAGVVSPLAAFLTPFEDWLLIGPALLLHSWFQGHASRNLVLGTFAIAIVAELGISVFVVARSAPAFAYSLTLLVLAGILGVLRLRYVVVGLVVAVLAWPTIHGILFERRVESGSVPASLAPGALDRLELDRFLILAEHSRAPDGLAPSVGEMLRLSLVPRFLDPERQVLATGTRVNQAIGGAPRSSISFTIFGQVLFFHGWLGIPLYGAIAAVLLGGLLRRTGPIALCAAALALRYFLWIEASYPDNIAAFTQGVIAALVAILVVRSVREMRMHRGRLPGAGLTT